MVFTTKKITHRHSNKERLVKIITYVWCGVKVDGEKRLASSFGDQRGVEYESG